MNQNEVARLGTRAEGLRKSTNIAQFKECLKVLNRMSKGEVAKIFRRIAVKEAVGNLRS